MFCTNCGKEIPAGARFCTNCGSPVPSGNMQSRPRQEDPLNRQKIQNPQRQMQQRPYEQPRRETPDQRMYQPRPEERPRYRDSMEANRPPYREQRRPAEQPRTYAPERSDNRKMWKWIGIVSSILMLISGFLPMYRNNERVIQGAYEFLVGNVGFYKFHYFMATKADDPDIRATGVFLLAFFAIGAFLMILFQLLDHSLLSLIGNVLLLLESIFYIYVIYGMDMGDGSRISEILSLGVGFWLMLLFTVICFISAFPAHKKKVKKYPQDPQYMGY